MQHVDTCILSHKKNRERIAYVFNGFSISHRYPLVLH